MIFRSHFSGSSGNLYEIISATNKRLLIDPGITWKKLQKALSYDLTNIVGCLLSHEHADHSKAVEDVLQAGIDVYASAETFESLGVVHRKAKVIEACRTCSMDGFEVFPFNLNHDVPILGFIIEDIGSSESTLFVTDTSHIKQRFGLAFNIISICCGYDGAVLRDRVDRGDINEELAKRLLTSHMEKQVAMDYIDKCCDLSKCTEIHLLHLSQNNINAEEVRKEFEDKFFVKTFINKS